MITLYHGSNMKVEVPDLIHSKPYKDFGKGFYTTSNPEQAERWAHIKQEREDAQRAVVSVYEFDEALLGSPDWNIRQFAGADEDWLYFVTDCRKSRGHNYDLVLGPVANDKVFTTVNLFESGVLSAEAAILQLKTYKTYDQMSFHTDRTIGTLRFVEAYEV
jgi:hypothetical protein